MFYKLKRIVKMKFLNFYDIFEWNMIGDKLPKYFLMVICNNWSSEFNNKRDIN